MKTKKSKVELFEELAEPDENGYSRPVPATEFANRYKSLATGGGGGGWCRSDGALGKKYKFERIKGGPGNAITGIQLQGYKKGYKKR